MLNKKRLFWSALMIIFIGINIYMLFHNLGKGFLIQTDEAYHATNAYEMLKQDNWVLNTYRYASDYFNSKPPLCLDLMILSYKIFGVSAFAARFPSALFGLITCIVIVAFLLHEKKIYAAAFFPMIFATCRPFFAFHMYRAAEMDSLFNLFFVIAMIALYKMRSNPSFMYVYGLSLGLAFMCKGPHASLIFFIGLLYIPKIREAFSSVKRVVISVILAAIIPLAWMIKRYMIDGFKLLNALFMGEVVSRVADSEKAANLPFITYFTSGTFIILAALTVLTVIFARINSSDSDEKDIQTVKSFLSDNYLYIIWIVVPIVFFAFTDYLTWYAYTSYIATSILSCILADYCITKAGKEKIVTKSVVSVILLVISLFYIVPAIKIDINLAGTGGNPVDQFTADLIEFKEKYGDEYNGTRAYLISNFNINTAVTDHWEPQYVAPAEMYVDLIPIDGTVECFLNDKDSIIIVDKELWDEYSSVLTGHVILYDNSYLIFSNEMY